ncbi:MAG: hypothetical protein ACM3ST_13255 [Bdellovibrio bacteriovorus]
MDSKLVPLMIVLTAVLLAAIAYPFYTFWRDRRRVAWNVVNAAFVLKTASPDLRRELDGSVQTLLPTHRMSPEAFAHAEPEVRLAMYSIAMQRMGLQPPGTGRPFYALSSPFLARSARNHILFVRCLVESEQRVSLEELDRPSLST